ncbi:MAG: DUF2207 domain-containing protein [Anaerolineae bacterium]|nr:DUF2207 domain-containing protein [Anaerolineae bacterium]NUQ02774.1 DUF2207 domain-containing protein [Anaerolineae bacterium]
MTSRRPLVFLLLTIGFVFSGLASAAAQDRSVTWKRWDVIIDSVDPVENAFRVSEVYDIQFSGTFRFGSRAIPYTNLDSITDVAVTQDGRPLVLSCSGNEGTVCAQPNGDELQITYYFRDPITNGSAAFVISYVVSGALRVYPDGDQLWWQAIPSDHFGFPIERSKITVELPVGYAPREGVDPVVTYGASSEVNVEGAMVTAVANGMITGSQYFDIRVQYPHHPDARQAGWQSGFDSQRAFEENTLPLLNVAGIVISILIGLGSLLGIFLLYNTRGRDPEIGPVPEYLTEPPSDLRPAVVGSLIDERADPRDVIATFVDLAQRGFLVIEEEKREGLFGLGGGSQFTFKRTDKNFDSLEAWERALVQGMFKGNRMERDLSALKETFYKDITKAQQALYGQLVKQGFFTSNPESTRTGYGLVGALLFGLAMVGAFVLFPLTSEYGFSMALIPISLFIPAAGFVIAAPAMPAKTRKGAEEAAKWKAFYRYMANLDKQTEVSEAKERFADYLPYAVAFGLDRTWVNAFSQVQDMPIPPWYYPTYVGHYRRGYMPGTPLSGSFDGANGVGLPGELARAGGGASLDDLSGGLSGGLQSISDGLTRMLNDASRVMTSRPQQASSGSSGSWRGGGSSWSGGGFSGGGSSGGGSSGFG